MARLSWISWEGTLQLLHQKLPNNAVAVEYPKLILKATPTCGSQSGTALPETYVASQRNLDVYYGSEGYWIQICAVEALIYQTELVSSSSNFWSSYV